MVSESNKKESHIKSRLFVIKRGGRKEDVHFDKITSRIHKLCYGLNSDYIDPIEITMKVISGLYPGVTTVELDNLAAETAATMTTKHPDYAILAARIAISNLHKETKKTFSDVIHDLYSFAKIKTGEPLPLISDTHHKIVMDNADRLNSAIIYDRDFNYNYFGFKTLERSYLLKIHGKVVERPQHMLMRVAVGIHGDDIDAAIETYNLMSEGYFTHASPTMFNAATPRPQLSSCFLVAMREDSIEGIYDTLKQTAMISKTAGGIGVHVHCIRAKGTFIAGTNGISNGLTPMLRVFNNTARYVDQGGNKRPGAFAVYIEPWHADVFEFLDLKKNTGKEEVRARDLFYALWIPDLFMERVESNGVWSLMCPHMSPGLADLWGEEFNKLYVKFHAITVVLKDRMLIDLRNFQSFGFTEENDDLTKLVNNRLKIMADMMKNWGKEWQNLRKSIEENADLGHHMSIKSCQFKENNFNVVIHGDLWTSNILFKHCNFTGNLCGVKYEQDGRFVRQVEARAVWNAIIESQVETGVPYMLYKDSCNRKSNQQNLGTIKCSNLCTEIIEYTSPDEVAVCNLASIALNKFVRQDKSYDFKKLKEVTKIVTRNLNKIIDVNYYPIVEARRSNLLHRPIGIGVQGLADLFIQMRIPFESDAAQELNKQIFETIYYGALEASYELAQLYGTYETYQGSPASKGILQYDMWNVTPSTLWDWTALKEKIAEHGLRNSLLLAPMPTASTAQILGNNESFEPFTTNIYTRRVLSGEFQVVNHHLLRDLVELKLWNDDMKNELIKNSGSVQNIKVIPDDLKALYKTVWEISQKTVLKMAAERGAFIDQSQSLNIHIAEPNYGKLTSMHFYAWKLGLKTGMYYLRTKPAAQAIQFTVDKSKTKQTVENGNKSLENGNNDMAAFNMASMVCSLENKDECLMCGS